MDVVTESEMAITMANARPVHLDAEEVRVRPAARQREQRLAHLGSRDRLHRHRVEPGDLVYGGCFDDLDVGGISSLCPCLFNGLRYQMMSFFLSK